MYRILIVIIFCCVSKVLLAQTSTNLFEEDYSSSEGWVQINEGVSIQGGKVRAIDASAYDFQNRIFKSLSSTIATEQNWSLETDFTFYRSPFGNPLFYVVALSTTDKEISLECTTPDVRCCTSYDDNGNCQRTELRLNSFYIIAFSPIVDPNNELNLGFGVGNKLDGGFNSASVRLEYEQYYHLVFNKVDSNYTLRLYTDSAKTNQVIGSTLTVTYAPPLPDYNFVQHSVVTAGGRSRYASVEIDNTSLRLLNKQQGEDSTFTIYNFVTANGDGKNDYFFIKDLSALQAYELLIFNRYGNVVYQTKDYHNDWDGKNLESGTYFYKLKYDNKEINDIIFLSR